MIARELVRDTLRDVVSKKIIITNEDLRKIKEITF
jgi:hypothetical protein